MTTSPVDFARKDVLTFDCYGTLIDWESGILAALQPLLRAHQTHVPDDAVLEAYAELESAIEAGPYKPYTEVLADVVRGFGRRFGFEPNAAEERALAASVGDWPAFADSPAALAALKRRFKLAIISNIDDALIAASQRRLGVDFDWIITAQQARSYKPSLNNFHLALARIGLPKDQLLHVAQSLFHDHVPAKALGLQTVWVNRRGRAAGSGATPPAAAQPDLEVPDLQTLAELAVRAA
jgi:2-haloacid dehalogenase